MLFYKGRKDQLSQGGDRGSWLAKSQLAIYSTLKLEAELQDKLSIPLESNHNASHSSYDFKNKNL